MAPAATIETNNRRAPWVGCGAGRATPRVLLLGRTFEDFLYFFGHEHLLLVPDELQQELLKSWVGQQRSRLPKDHAEPGGPIVGLVPCHIHQVFEGRERRVGVENARRPSQMLAEKGLRRVHRANVMDLS